MAGDAVPHEPPDLLRALRDGERGRRNLRAVAAALGPERYRDLLPALARALPRSPDPDMALNNFERFVVAGPGLGASRAPGPAELTWFLQLLGTSQFCADLLAAQPDLIET